MNIEWKPTHSRVRPEDVDYMSSSTTIYLHRNITQYTDEDGQIMYKYDVAKLTPSEFAIYSEAKNNEAMLTIMEALADIYEMVGDNA